MRLDKFETEYYPDGGVKDWKSTVTVVEGGAPVLTRVVEVNEPLDLQGFSFYQTSYGWDWTTPRLDLELRKPGDPPYLKTVTLKVGERAASTTRTAPRRRQPGSFPTSSSARGTGPKRGPSNPTTRPPWSKGWNGEERVFSGWIFAKYPRLRPEPRQRPDVRRETNAGRPPRLNILRSRGQYSVLEAAKDPGRTLIWLGCMLSRPGSSWPSTGRPGRSGSSSKSPGQDRRHRGRAGLEEPGRVQVRIRRHHRIAQEAEMTEVDALHHRLHPLS